MDQKDEVKQKSDIVAVISEFVQLKKAGRNYKGLCPFHSEKTPSFMVSPELQMYKCFGCSESGDVISFLQQYEGMEFYEALKWLADRVGIKLKPLRPGQAGEKERLLRLNLITSRFYQYLLLNHTLGKKALSYLTRERGLKLDTIKKFELGYSPDKPGALANVLTKKKGFEEKELDKAGLTYSRGGRLYDRFSGRVIFPLSDHRDNIIGFAGRLLPSTKSDMAKYINSPETPLYHKSRVLYGLNYVKDDIRKEGDVIVVEGELDMISSWQAGRKNVVALKGSALTEEQIKLINRFTPKLILALDEDVAGDSAARRGIVVAQEAGIEVRVARLGDYKDPDEMARKNPKGYEKALSSTVGVWDYYIDSAFEKYNPETGEGKAKISKNLVPILSLIPDKIVQAHYIEVVAEKLKVPTEAVSEQVEKVSGGQPKEKEPEDEKQDLGKSRRELLEERLLAIAFQTDPNLLNKKNIVDLIKKRAHIRLLEEYRKYSKGKSDFDPSLFSEKLPKELFKTFSEMILLDLDELIKNPDKLKKEKDYVIGEIKILDIKDNLNILSKKINKYEKNKEKIKLTNAQKKFGDLSRKLVELEEEMNKGII